MIYVLRLGHRPGRDKRITTHVALVARAFCCDGIFIEGRDESILKSVEKVKKRFGKKGFLVDFTNSPRSLLNELRHRGFTLVHLTMYGISIDNIIEKLKGKNILVIVGSEKVERYYYEVVDYNVSVTNQPHSEVAALAIFLDRLFSGRELYSKFEDAEFLVIPSERGKKVVRIGKEKEGKGTN
jgi:tRNA (cytidine56-2'-O)-methyltransferase